MRDSDATISNNIITGNIGYLLGGGIYVQRGTPRIQYNRIQNNTADGQSNFALGGGIGMETAAGLRAQQHHRQQYLHWRWNNEWRRH